VTCDVYFGTDPNALLNPKIVSKQAVESASISLAADTLYYWKINVYDSSISATVPYLSSPVFTFNTFNIPPVVDAGADVETWSIGEPRVVALNGSVVHPHNLPVTQAWTVLSEPDPLNPAVISDSSALHPTVTLNAVGTYVVQLEATDGEFITTDTMQIVVYSDACEHASHQPGFVRLSTDFNRDCTVDLLDMASFSTQWLEWNYSVE
jgi:hypothetical protein